MGTSAMRSIQMAHNIKYFASITFILLQSAFLVNSEQIITNSGSALDWFPLGAINYESKTQYFNGSETGLLSSFSQSFKFPVVSDELVFDLKVKNNEQVYEVKFGEKVLINGVMKGNSWKNREITAFVPELQESEVLDFKFKGSKFEGDVNIEKINSTLNLEYSYGSNKGHLVIAGKVK